MAIKCFSNQDSMLKPQFLVHFAFIRTSESLGTWIGQSLDFWVLKKLPKGSEVVAVGVTLESPQGRKANITEFEPVYDEQVMMLYDVMQTSQISSVYNTL